MIAVFLCDCSETEFTEFGFGVFVERPKRRRKISSSELSRQDLVCMSVFPSLFCFGGACRDSVRIRQDGWSGGFKECGGADQ